MSAYTFLNPRKNIFWRISILVFSVLHFFLKRKPVPFAFEPGRLDRRIKYEKGKIFFKKNKILVRYLITRQNNKYDDSENFIIFLHGISKNEYQWVLNKGFARQFYGEADKIKNFKTTTVVSVSFGMSYLLINKLPYPFQTDMEKLFIKDFIPFIRKKLNKKGKIFLIGHSLGAFNAMIPSFKYPDIFPAVLLMSPFISAHSPFDENFLYNNPEMLRVKWWANMVRDMMIYAFTNAKNYLSNSPYELTKIKKRLPKIVITKTGKELDGFNENIKRFIDLLKKKKSKFYYYLVKGNHHKFYAEDGFKKFIEVIKNYELKKRK